jgi:hypothetical protein
MPQAECPLRYDRTAGAAGLKFMLERFQAKACPGFDPGWMPVRVKKTRQMKK